MKARPIKFRILYITYEVNNKHLSKKYKCPRIFSKKENIMRRNPHCYNINRLFNNIHQSYTKNWFEEK